MYMSAKPAKKPAKDKTKPIKAAMPMRGQRTMKNKAKKNNK
jgi:hypothetical protein